MSVEETVSYAAVTTLQGGLGSDGLVVRHEPPKSAMPLSEPADKAVLNVMPKKYTDEALQFVQALRTAHNEITSRAVDDTVHDASWTCGMLDAARVVHEMLSLAMIHGVQPQSPTLSE